MEQAANPLRVLVVEDNQVNQKLAKALLEKRGHLATIAGSGEEALSLFRADSFDVILMDVQMPGMDGYQTTAAIRGRERDGGGHMPIIAMTAHAMSGDRERCLAAGMDHYISKPFKPDDLYSAVETYGAKQGASPAQTPPENLITREELIDKFGGDPGMLTVMIDIFVEEAPRQLEQIEITAAGTDTVALRAAAHTLKGSVGVFTIGPIFDLCYRLEKLAADGGNKGAPELAAEISAKLTSLLANLKSLL